MQPKNDDATKKKITPKRRRSIPPNLASYQLVTANTHSFILEPNNKTEQYQYFLTQLKLSKPQLNHNSTQPKITLSWVRHENDFAHHPTLHPPHKLNVSNISAVSGLIWMKL